MASIIMLVNTSSPAFSANLEVSDYILEQWKGPLLIQANRLIKNQPRVIDNENLWENAWQDYANRQPPIAWKSHYVAIALALPGVMGGSTLSPTPIEANCQSRAPIKWQINPPKPGTSVSMSIIDSWFIVLLDNSQGCFSSNPHLTAK